MHRYVDEGRTQDESLHAPCRACHLSHHVGFMELILLAVPEHL